MATTNQFDNYTETARRVLELAKEEAISFNSPEISTLHILIGLLRKATGMGVLILTRLGCSPDQLIDEIREICGFGPTVFRGELQLSDGSKIFLDLTRKISNDLAHPYIGTEHQLLALLELGMGKAYEVLHSHGVTTVQVKHEMLKLLSSGGQEAKQQFRSYLRARIDTASEQINSHLEGITSLVVEKYQLKKELSELDRPH